MNSNYMKTGNPNFTKGHEKTGGREQGTPNHLTKEMRTILKGIVSKELSNLSEILEKLEPLDRAEMIIKLIPYVLPKIEPVQMEKGEPLDPDFSVY